MGRRSIVDMHKKADSNYCGFPFFFLSFFLLVMEKDVLASKIDFDQ